MFKSLQIEFENGYCLINSISFDNSAISEMKTPHREIKNDWWKFENS